MNTLRTQPWRLTLATLTLALAAGFAQPVLAQPSFAQPMGEHGARHGRADGGQHLKHMLDSVNATGAQREQIETIMQGARSELKAIHASGRQLRQQQTDLLAKPTIDARAAETLRQQGMALHEQASKRMLQARLDAAAVLSAEQRAQLANRMQQHRALMERHRAERQTLDDSPSRASR